jgi:hypothetical protein
MQVGYGKEEQKQNATAGSFDKLRTGSSTTLRFAQDDRLFGPDRLIETVGGAPLLVEFVEGFVGCWGLGAGE